MKRERAVLLIVACLFTVLSAAQPPPAGEFAELETLARAELASIRAPGAAIAVVKGDRVVYQRGVGVANVDNGQPVDADMLFRVGSVTKMYTAAALVSLAEEGRLKLADPIGKYASGLSGRLSRVTAHQLLSHTAGIRDDAPAYGWHDDTSLAATVRSWGDDYVFLDPGRVMSYSNPGVTLAGYVTEQIAKKPYADVIEERLFKPLGMQRTTFRPTVAMTWPLAQGHSATGAEPPAVVRPFADNAGYWPAGFMISSAPDLAKFTIAFMNDGMIDGRPVLKPSTITAMSTGYADVPSSAEPARYGYGLTTATHRGVRIVEHGGSIDGFGASVRMLPDHKGAVIIVVNRTGASLPKTSERALEMVAPLQPAATTTTPAIAMETSELTKYAGTYSNPPQRIDLVARDGKLYFRRSGAADAEVTKIGDLRFSIGGSPAPRVFALVPGPDGAVAFLHIGSRAYKKITTKSS